MSILSFKAIVAALGVTGGGRLGKKDGLSFLRTGVDGAALGEVRDVFGSALAQVQRKGRLEGGRADKESDESCSHVKGFQQINYNLSKLSPFYTRRAAASSKSFLIS